MATWWMLEPDPGFRHDRKRLHLPKRTLIASCGGRLSFLTGATPKEAWAYFNKHVDLIPLMKNADQVRQFLFEKEENCKYSTLGGYLGHIKAFGIYLDNRPWLDATRDDVIIHIKGAVGQQGRENRPFSGRGQRLGSYTKYQRMVMLREFYKWLLETDECPAQFVRMPFRKPTMDEQMKGRYARITQDEVISLLCATEDVMHRALILLLLDGGFRAGEIFAFNIGNEEFDDYGAKLLHDADAVGLKSGPRRVATRITFAAPYLWDWLQIHPRRNQAGTPIFISRSNRNFGARLSENALWTMLDRLCRRAKIRHINPHMFRHTAASVRSGDGWNEEMMRLHFGWSKGSNMPSYYSHVEQDYDAFALRRAGIPVQAAPPESWSSTCAQCRQLNAIDATHCIRCRARLEE